MKKSYFPLLTVLYALMLSLGGLELNAAEPLLLQDEAEIEADSVSYEPDGKTVRAEGNVQVDYQGMTLKTQGASFDQTLGKIRAEGGLVLNTPEGHVFYATTAELSDDLNQGIINELNGTLSDNSRVAADSAIRESKTVTHLDNAIYSPCSICKDNKKHPPLWAVTADRVTLDETEERLYYKNAALEVYGVPVLYTPYLSHAAPGAGRKTGFLVPTYRSINTLGLTVELPYYINIAPQMDVTVAPILTTEEGIVMKGEFRHRLENGQYTLSGSITNPAERDDTGRETTGRNIRGHIHADGRFDLSHQWQWGFDLNRSSDDTYLERYKFSQDDVLTSLIYAERLEERNFFGVRGLSFQGLEAEDDPGTSPLILPLMKAHWERNANFRDSKWTLDSNAAVLIRDEGQDSRRLSSIVGWEIPHITPGGHIFNLRTSLRGDVYSVDDVITSTGRKSGITGRIIPEAELHWTYPLSGQYGGHGVVLEPVADFIVSPNGGNPDKIPNEDSQNLELSDVNLFSNDHSTGYDRIEGGARTNYGMRGSWYGPQGRVNFLVGQSYRVSTDDNFTEESGLSDNFSDAVGRLSYTHDSGWQIAYRFRMDKDDYTMRRNEVGGYFNLDMFTLQANYVVLDEENNSLDRKEISGSVGIPISDHWSISAYGRRNLSDNGGWVSSGGTLIYENECLRLNTGIEREYTRDRDVEPSTSFTLKIALKHFGN